MEQYKLGEQEMRFADLLWNNAPISSSNIVSPAAEVMNWKKSTTYTMLHRLYEHGIFKHENATIAVLMSRNKFYPWQSRKYVEDAFGGSLPRFVASFIGDKSLTNKQADELVRLIYEHKRGRGNG